MLARLRREFIAITMLLVGLVLMGVLSMIFVSNAATLRSVTSRILDRALEGSVTSAQIGDTTGEQSAEIMLAVVVELAPDGTPIDLGDSVLAIPQDTLDDVVTEIMGSSTGEGECAAYPISWKRARMPWGWRVALVDTYSRDAALRTQALNQIVIFAVSMAALFIVSYLLSGWALRPVVRAWEQQRRFISDASHELKTPLAVILANAQILERDSGVDESARRWVVSTREEATHMKELVDDLLTLARADEADDSSTTPDAQAVEEIDLTDIVSGCCLEFDAVAFERECTIESSLAPQVRARVRTDDYRRVVRTLLDNATKYARTGTTVRVTLDREGKRSRLAVSNFGETISPDELEHLFDRFYRTDRARSRQGVGGFGLGLSIAKTLVESAGGTIKATSTEKDGTTFVVLI